MRQLGFYFNQQRCIGCDTCAVACKQWHEIPAGPASWRRVETIESGQFPSVRVTHLSLACCHCAQPACIPACPVGAITKREQDGIVLVDRERCLPGCRACLAACPYQAPQFRDDQSPMEMCDFCLDRLEEGKPPLCVASCPVRALEAGPLEELERLYGTIRSAVGFADPTATQPAVVFRCK